jgi:hypothetical protein
VLRDNQTQTNCSKFSRRANGGESGACTCARYGTWDTTALSVLASIALPWFCAGGSLAFAAPVTVEELIGRRAHELYVASIIPELSQIIKNGMIFFLKSAVCFMLMIT